jgi:hypothetical protein
VVNENLKLDVELEDAGDPRRLACDCAAHHQSGQVSAFTSSTHDHNILTLSNCAYDLFDFLYESFSYCSPLPVSCPRSEHAEYGLNTPSFGALPFTDHDLFLYAPHHLNRYPSSDHRWPRSWADIYGPIHSYRSQDERLIPSWTAS